MEEKIQTNVRPLRAELGGFPEGELKNEQDLDGRTKAEIVCSWYKGFS